MVDPEPESFSAPLVWVGADEIPILLANSFVSQFDRDGSFILTIGQLTPPALMGTPEEIIEQAKQVAFVPIKVIARLGISEPRLRELVAVLQANLDNYERAGRMEPGDPR